MGEVWLVHDREMDERVVAKLVPPGAREAQVDLLRRELRQVRRLNHPAIVRVFDLHRGDETTFFTMEWIEGEPLSALRGRPVAAVLTVLLPIVDALAHLHEKGIVHRDLKAANILVGADGRARLLDFGVSGRIPGPIEDEEELPLRGGGTPSAMSPEQRAGEPPHPADDLYALGVLLENLLSDPASEPLPPELASLIAALRSPRRRDRPPGMAAVKRQIETIVEALEGTEGNLGLEPSRVPVRKPAPASPLGAAGQSGTPKPDRLVPPPRPGEQRSRIPALVPPETPPPGRAGSAERGRRKFRFLAPVSVLLLFAALMVFLWLPGRSRWSPAVVPSPGLPQRLEARAPEGSPGTGGNRPMVEAASPTEPPAEPLTEPLAEPGRTDVEGPLEKPLAGPTRLATSEVLPASPETLPPRPAPEVEAFTAAVSEGLAALDREDYAAAGEAFERAAALRPGSSESADGLVRAREGLRLETIRGLRREAESAAEGERWRAAAEAYTAILGVDPTVAFALEGRKRSLERAELAERLAYHLDHAERLASVEVLDEAAGLLERAREIERPGPRLAAQVAELERRVEEFSTPLPVVLVSDEQTEVTIYRVGRLGTFLRQTLDLRPGTYTVVGSRRGYRDVRLELIVRPGEAPDPLPVRCEEEI